ncbi:MAG: hypothetical protein C0448_15680 [Sphingobacteriaceae bacterium]|nr:hypothetical protein [Sphingobacteriaceae bacterium]
MNLKHIIISASVLTVGLLSVNAIKKGEPKDSLDKRIFTVTMTEVKEGTPPKKGVEDEIEFKAGKGMFSTFLFDKLEYKWLKYEITKDSVYTDEEQNESRWVEAEISTTDDKDQTMVMKCVVDNYDISGEVKITKKDKLKKKYEFSGKEKPKKK